MIDGTDEDALAATLSGGKGWNRIGRGLRIFSDSGLDRSWEG